jgi:hypothetical protein
MSIKEKFARKIRKIITDHFLKYKLDFIFFLLFNCLFQFLFTFQFLFYFSHFYYFLGKPQTKSTSETFGRPEQELD